MLNEQEQQLLNESYLKSVNESKKINTPNSLQSQKNLLALVDWLKLSIPMNYEEMIVNVLGVDLELFDEQEGRLPHAIQDKVLRFSGIAIWHSEKTSEIILDISGTGLQTLRENVFFDYSEVETIVIILDKIIKCVGYETHTLKEKQSIINCQRIDLTVDDKNVKPFYTPEKIRKYFISGKAKFGKTLKISSEIDDLTRALTFYIGDRVHRKILVRVYNKFLEKQTKEKLSESEMIQLFYTTSWIRTEVEFHDRYADEILWSIYQLGKNKDYDLLDFSKGYLDHKIHFFPPDNYNSKKEIYRPRFWKNFIAKAQEVVIKVPRRETVPFSKKLWNFTYLGKGGGMGAIIRFMTYHHLPFPEEVVSEENIYNKASISRELIDKFNEYLVFIGRDDLLNEFRNLTQNNKK